MSRTGRAIMMERSGGPPLILRGRDLRMAAWIVRAVDLAMIRLMRRSCTKRPNAHGAWDFTSNSTVGSG